MKKFCVNCIHFHPGRYQDLCMGPHIRLSLITGQRVMPLPDARYSGGVGLDRKETPCGEEGSQYRPSSLPDGVEETPPPPSKTSWWDYIWSGKFLWRSK